MLAEFLEALEERLRKAEAPTVFKDGKMMFKMPDGSMATEQAPPDPRNHKAFDLTAIVEFAKSSDMPAIWYSRNAVVCLIADENRRDRVTLDLTLSPQMQALQQLEKNPREYAQASMVLALRTTFDGCFADEASAALLPAVRAMKFTRNEEGESTIDHGKASIGKKLTEKATGAVAIPEVVRFNVPIFGNAFDWKATVACAVDIDAATEKFKLIPLPLQIERAIAEGERKIAIAIATTISASTVEIPIRYGNP